MKTKQLLRNVFSFLPVFLFSFSAFAESEGAGGSSGLIALGSGIAIGVAALGGTLGQGKVSSAALEGLARNPQAREAMFVPMIIGLVLIESLVIYALVIAFLLTGKI